MREVRIEPRGLAKGTQRLRMVEGVEQPHALVEEPLRAGN